MDYVLNVVESVIPQLGNMSHHSRSGCSLHNLHNTKQGKGFGDELPFTSSQGGTLFDFYERSWALICKILSEDESYNLATKAVSNSLQTSLGPKGLNKLLVSSDGDITITNNKVTILKMMDVDHQVKA